MLPCLSMTPATLCQEGRWGGRGIGSLEIYQQAFRTDSQVFAETSPPQELPLGCPLSPHLPVSPSSGPFESELGCRAPGRSALKEMYCDRALDSKPAYELYA